MNAICFKRKIIVNRIHDEQNITIFKTGSVLLIFLVATGSKAAPLLPSAEAAELEGQGPESPGAIFATMWRTQIENETNRDARRTKRQRETVLSEAMLESLALAMPESKICWLFVIGALFPLFA